MQTLRAALLLLPLWISSAQRPEKDLITRPSQALNYTRCTEDLYTADRDNDGFVRQSEYLDFIQLYGESICFSTDKLTLQQHSTFNTLACLCHSQEGMETNCCIRDNARISTSGANLPANERSPNQKNYLTTVCKLTDATIEAHCPPTWLERAPPPDGLVKEPDEGGNDGLLWGLIAAALLLMLLCCCCCFVLRRRKKREEEEEEEEEVMEEGLGKAAEAPEQPPVEAAVPLGSAENYNPEAGVPGAPGAMSANPVGPGGFASGEADASDSDEEEEGRKRRGGGNLPGDKEDPSLKIPTAPRLPPPPPPEDPNLNLRPIPDEETSDDEWDHAGRHIDTPKDDSEQSGQVFDPYVPDGGVNIPERPSKDSVNWKNEWNRGRPDEPDEVDNRKHRIQSGLGEGEVWDKLNQDDTTTDRQGKTGGGDMFDWVVQSALGTLDNNQTPSSQMDIMNDNADLDRMQNN